ncbi:hypothetical protein AK812_SmicGene24273 [Symbiodinium microadriaticum]|uniref:Uncharacterized protein n=1 Tax=Symbiodinium microadriaticum TaxID=2951 RepID=A0A1Q9DF06_SYMMI|nr:hypothetical protein AK812_SmicGene24273 [Symbiodinium microadriaticum]
MASLPRSAIWLQASHGVEDEIQACQEILDKMLRPPGSCQHIGTMRTDSAFMVSALKKEQATESFFLFSRWYGGVPLSNLGPCSRGHRLEEIAFSIDQKLHPDSTFRLQGRGQNRACADWLRDDTRVEFKSSTLRWDSSRQSWRVQFRQIKFGPLGADEEARAKMAAGMQMQQDSDLQKMQEQQAQKQEMEVSFVGLEEGFDKALERLSRIGLVKPEKKEQEKITDGQLSQLMEKM